MGKANFTEDFKRDAVVQITERRYPVAEAAARLGIACAIRAPVHPRACGEHPRACGEQRKHRPD